VFRLEDLSGGAYGLIYLTDLNVRFTDGPLEFVMLSSHGDTDKRRWGPRSVEGLIHYFDEKTFPWRGEGSGIVNVLLIQWSWEIARRLAVAQIHANAWKAACPWRKHIRLG
jgi:hypothetical protein